MPKLHLKRTPEEEAQHQLRKEKKRAKRKRQHEHDRHYEATTASGSNAYKRSHRDGDMNESHTRRKWASSDEDDDTYGPQPAGPSYSAHHKSMEDYAAELEEQRFREKVFDALGDDERLDGIEARFNDFAQVPDRWRSSGSKRRVMAEDEFEDVMKLDPQYMDDEEYTEWIRMGMYRKTHAKEYEEQQRQKAAHAAQRAEAETRKKETERLERQAKEEERQRRRERESQKMEYAREEYHKRWKTLLSLSSAEEELQFEDIPWPIVAAHRQKPEKKRGGSVTDLPRGIGVEDLTAEAISAFILPLISTGVRREMDEEAVRKGRKEKLRETLLRFHPDKFEGRFMQRVRENDRKRVREGIGQVSRVLNGLL